MKQTEYSIRAVNHQRGLVIGIGGCGAEVLSANRRRIIEKYGSLENVPMIRYLYVDTDPKWWKGQQSRVEKNVQLAEQEFVDIQLAGTNELYQGIKQGNYPHYGWFDVQKLENIKSVTDGAGTVRQMARLAFWQHYNMIREAIEQQLNDLRNDSVATFMRTRHGIQLDDGINVYIVAGLGGGTGSGLWLDMAYLVRKVLEDMGITGANQIVGYGILPQAFKDLPGANSQANGYAVLKELNYFSYLYSPTNPLSSVFGEPAWDADYQHDAVSRVTFKQQPPFDFCYLLDARNKTVDLHRKDIFNMIDCAIFNEFAGSFATFKRSLRANIRGKLTMNDRTDCPIGFMSFGQSSAMVPLPEIRQVLAHRLALQAVQEWVEMKSEPINVFSGDGQDGREKMVESVVGSIREKARDQALVGRVRGWLLKDFIKANGLNNVGVFASIIQEQQERLTDIPYARIEVVKQEWIAENWAYDGYIGRLKNAWEKLHADFDDEGTERMRWGECIRKLESNKASALKAYAKLFKEKAFQLFEDPEHFGPAFAVCTLQQLKAALALIKQTMLNEAGSANAIANALGDTFVIDAVTGGKGPSLSAIIDAKASQDLARLDELIRRVFYWDKRKAVGDAAYQYLRSCALWCRARVEERARREAAELVDQMVQVLGALEDELIGHAAVLASLEGELVMQARAWNQRAAENPNVGTLLYDADVLKTLEAKLRKRQGDLYSSAIVGRKALELLGRNIRDLQATDVPALMKRLVEAGVEAVGDLTEAGMDDTEFAAHDLLSAAHETDETMDSSLRDVIRKSAPYIRLVKAVEDGGWTPDKLEEIDGAGLRGGGWKANDTDRDHARVVDSMARNGWNIRDGVRPVEDGCQIVFFQECGGFPLRALQGVQEMKRAYDQHRKQPNTAPLHIVRDELAESYPDLYPPRPEVLERARVVQTVALPLGFVAPTEFPSADGKGKPRRLLAFLRDIPELGETQAVPLGKTVETIGLKLANQLELLGEIEKTIEVSMGKASEADKAGYAEQMREYLADKKAALQAACPGFDAANSPAYQSERERVVGFMRKFGLTLGAVESEKALPFGSAVA